jgi:hypothetical protein
MWALLTKDGYELRIAMYPYDGSSSSQMLTPTHTTGRWYNLKHNNMDLQHRGNLRYYIVCVLKRDNGEYTETVGGEK